MIEPAPNYRDVGKAVNRLAGAPLLVEGAIFRSGELNLVRDPKDLGEPKSILCLEAFKGAAWGRFGEHLHFPFPDTVDVYDLASAETSKWAIGTIRAIVDSRTEMPILVHCTAGKDRTGVIVCVLLSFLGISEEIVAEEYRLSSGPLDSEAFQRCCVEALNLKQLFPELVHALRLRFLVEEQIPTSTR